MLSSMMVVDGLRIFTEDRVVATELHAGVMPGVIALHTVIMMMSYADWWKRCVVGAVLPFVFFLYGHVLAHLGTSFYWFAFLAIPQLAAALFSVAAWLTRPTLRLSPPQAAAMLIALSGVVDVCTTYRGAPELVRVALAVTVCVVVGVLATVKGRSYK